MTTSQPPTLSELLDTWQTWSRRDLLTRTAAQAAAAGNAEHAKILARGLDNQPRVEPLEALAANQELASLLTLWQWHAVRAARETGATWPQIATALGTSPEQARATYLHRIERAERYGGDTDTAPYRAVLDDRPPRPLSGGTSKTSPNTTSSRSSTVSCSAELIPGRPDAAPGSVHGGARRAGSRR